MFIPALAAILAVLLMARRGRARRKYRRYIRGNVEHVLSLSTLGPAVVISEILDDVLVEKAWLSSCKLIWSMSELTLSPNDGPIMVGVAHSDYTSTEIEEWIENTGAWDQGDKRTQEIASRKIRMVGTFPVRVGAATGVAVVLNDGKPIRTKCNWQLITAQSLRVWAFNLGSSALAGTNPQVQINGFCNLWPN